MENELMARVLVLMALSGPLLALGAVVLLSGMKWTDRLRRRWPQYGGSGQGGL